MASGNHLMMLCKDVSTQYELPLMVHLWVRKHAV